ncbi:MAG TPA: ribulose-phosphate 3-epimerase, partial [bacterium]|nr:ribulose-phosphate 3-epimerase [bacterium]
GEEIRDVEKAGCDLIHVDVMDGHFVPNLTIGPPVIRWIRKTTKLPLDVHLMIEEPFRYLEDFKKAGSDWITVHVEATKKMDETLQALKKASVKSGVSLRPKTSLDSIIPYLDRVDLVLVMTVEPGFGGQSFMPDMMTKVKDLRSRFTGLISVDGGITPETGPPAVASGADILVAGTAVFGQKDRHAAIQALRSCPSEFV